MSATRKAARAACGPAAWAATTLPVYEGGGGGSSTPIPVNTVAPAIPSDPVEGDLQAGEAGTWNDADSLAYQWFHGEGGGAISGADAIDYTPTEDDIGLTLLLRETAVGEGGHSVEAWSNESNAVVAGPDFTPLLDGLSSSPLGAWGYVQLLSTYTGPLFRLRRDSDNAESDFSAVSGGEPDSAAITAWAAGANLFVVKEYDQSGDTNDLVQATAANQPQFTVDAMGGKPGQNVTAVDRWLQPASSADFNGLMSGGMAFHIAYQTQSALQSFQSPIWSKDNLFNRGFGFGLDDTNKAMMLIQCATSDASYKASAATTSKVYCETINCDGTVADTALTWRRNGASLSYTGVAGSGAVINDNLTLMYGKGAFQDGQKVRKGQFVIFAAPLSSGDLQTVNDRATAFYGAT